MVYHSSFNDAKVEQICGCPLLPLCTTTKGQASETREPDIVDESIHLFKANVLFRAFEVQGSADKLLIYLTMYIINCLKRGCVVQRVETHSLLVSFCCCCVMMD